MLPYQLGTALVQNTERIVVQSQTTAHDLRALLSSTHLWHALAREPVEPPASLMQMMDQWPYWQAFLSQVVDYVFAPGVTDEFPGRLYADELRWRAPLRYPRKLICLGTNYRDHIAEMSGGSGKPPAQPYSFLKPPTTTLIGSGEPFVLPTFAAMLDWEVELAVIIGRKAHQVQGDEAMACIAGYSILNDLSARDWLAQPTPVGINWVMSKAFDGAAPMGPLITPAPFVADPQNLRLTLTVNGQVKQDSTTGNMVFGVRAIIEHLATIMTLEPGDVIATGTPAGVGFARKPPERLKAGDVVVAEIEGLGRLETPVREP